MDILSDVSIKGNLSLSGDMNVDDDFGINHCGSKLKISGSPNCKCISLKVIDSSGYGANMYINSSLVTFNQTAIFNSGATFRDVTNFSKPAVFADSIKFDCKDLSFVNHSYVSLGAFYDDNQYGYLDVNSSVAVRDSFYKKSSSGDFVRIDNKFWLTVPENCTKFHIFNGIIDTGTTEIFLPVINSYEEVSSGFLKKVEMDIFLTEDSIVVERVSTEQKKLLFSFYFA